MKDSFKDIWTNDFMLEATNATITAHNISEGSSVLPPGIASLGKFYIISQVSVMTVF